MHSSVPVSNFKKIISLDLSAVADG